MQTQLRQTGSLSKPQRRIALWVLLTFCVQAMFAQGTMAGSGSWVELCTADSGSVQLVYLGDEEVPPQHADENECTFAASADVNSQPSGLFEATAANTYVYSNPVTALSSARFTSAQARAPPLALS